MCPVLSTAGPINMRANLRNVSIRNLAVCLWLQRSSFLTVASSGTSILSDADKYRLPRIWADGETDHDQQTLGKGVVTC